LQCNEIVFVKDGPLSNELELVLGKFEDTLPFKFVEISVNKGLGNALKQGLEQCGNEIVIRMDTDDICEPNRFAEQFNYMNAHPAIDIVGSWAYDIEGNDTIIGERKYPLKHEDIYRLMWTNPIIHPSVAFRKSKIIAIGSYDAEVVRRQDYELWIRAAFNGLKFANIDKFLLKYRFTDNYYKKNSTKVVYAQAIMGLKGARKLKLPKYVYLAVFAPVLRTLLPPFLVKPLHKLMSKVDPRKK
jgi:glycosyltransferase involved in cell wall biosynthesis